MFVLARSSFSTICVQRRDCWDSISDDLPNAAKPSARRTWALDPFNKTSRLCSSIDGLDSGAGADRGADAVRGTDADRGSDADREPESDVCSYEVLRMHRRE